MALIVENGSIVPGADSYVSLADARALAAKYRSEEHTSELQSH